MSVVRPPIHRVQRLGSTLDRLHELAARGAPEGTLVVADEQTAGRGSRGRAWHSPEGGLWLSWLCRPAHPVGVEVLSLRVGLAVAHALDALGGLPPVRLKWPNDVMIGERKLGGILCEARWQGDRLGWIAVGLGMNVRNELPAEVKDHATRLADYRPGLTVDDLLALLIARLELIPGRPGKLSEEELEDFTGRDWLAARHLAAPLPGIARGIAPDGTLRIERSDGSLSIVHAGHVELQG
jgi:BirA family biotin operon repressor/biotin-[acetyl-CoA-carboxylase] ligase